MDRLLLVELPTVIKDPQRVDDIISSTSKSQPVALYPNSPEVTAERKQVLSLSALSPVSNIFLQTARSFLLRINKRTLEGDNLEVTTLLALLTTTFPGRVNCCWTNFRESNV